MKDFVPRAKSTSNHFQFTGGASVAVAFAFSAGLIPVEASWTRCRDAAATEAVVTSWTNVPGCRLRRSGSLWSHQAVETWEERKIFNQGEGKHHAVTIIWVISDLPGRDQTRQTVLSQSSRSREGSGDTEAPPPGLFAHYKHTAAF